MKKKFFFFGIDSATWDLIIPWAKEGKLPGFAKLLEEGQTSKLASTIPPLTPVAWPTAMTGLNPAEHGFYDFYRLDQSRQITINLASELPQPFFWERLSDKGCKTAVFNIPITYPFRPVNGIFISGLMTPGTKADFIVPKNLKSTFLKKFPRFHFAPSIKVSRQDPESYCLRLKENIADAEESVRVAKWLFAKDNWDLFVINFMAVDHVQHFFWEFMNDKNSPYKDAILRVYQIIDSYLLEVLEKYSDKYQVMVFSDHGAGPLEQTLFLNHWLEEKGWLRFKNSWRVYLKRFLAKAGFTPESLIRAASKLGLVRRAGKVNMQSRNRLLNKLLLSYADLDWDKTRAYSFGMYGGIFLTKKDPYLEVEIVRQMKKDFGKKLTYIELSEKIYHTKSLPKTIPNIQFLLKDGAIVSTNIYAFSGNKLFTKPITNKSGEHRVEGILAFYPKLQLGSKKPNLLDITPTILDFFDQPIPSYCQGQSLFAQIKPLDIDEIEI
jgi:predicted AlkP superfamily phosphohydrolase/phosphomutase